MINLISPDWQLMWSWSLNYPVSLLALISTQMGVRSSGRVRAGSGAPGRVRSAMPPSVPGNVSHLPSVLRGLGEEGISV